MRFVLILIVLVFLPLGAMAKGKEFGGMLWHPDHWEDSLFYPYTDPPRVMQDPQWRDDPWTPAGWIATHGGPQNTMAAFKRAGLIQKTTTRRGVPVLVVGAGYMDLSPRDRARLAATVDSIFGLTQKSPYVFHVRAQGSKTPLGLYTKDGLQAR